MKQVMLRGVVTLIGLAAALVGAGLWAAANSARNQEMVLEQLVGMETLLKAENVSAPAVSAWSVHQHVEHLLRANEGMLGMIHAAEAPESIEPKTPLGRFVLMSGYIPRGRGQAPESTVPEGLSPGELLVMCSQVEAAAQALDADQLPEGVVGNHMVFGGFDGADWLRLMAVHDAHHLKIVADIREAAGTP